MQNKLLYKYFSDDDFLRISNKIQENEKLTSGEIRVSFKEAKPLFQKSKNVRHFALLEFERLGMDKTRDKTGILIFIILKERQFYILADSGINEKVDQNTWDSISKSMEKEFMNGNYLRGILDTIEKAGKILGEYFPIKPDDTNELSNKVQIS